MSTSLQLQKTCALRRGVKKPQFQNTSIAGGPEVNCHMARELRIDEAKKISRQSFGKIEEKRQSTLLSDRDS